MFTRLLAGPFSLDAHKAASCPAFRPQVSGLCWGGLLEHPPLPTHGENWCLVLLSSRHTPQKVMLLTWASLVAQLVKDPPAMWETWVWSLSWEDPLEKGKATHSSILDWRIPWTVQSMGSQRVGHDWATFTALVNLLITCFPSLKYKLSDSELHYQHLEI